MNFKDNPHQMVELQEAGKEAKNIIYSTIRNQAVFNGTQGLKEMQDNIMSVKFPAEKHKDGSWKYSKMGSYLYETFRLFKDAHKFGIFFDDTTSRKALVELVCQHRKKEAESSSKPRRGRKPRSHLDLFRMNIKNAELHFKELKTELERAEALDEIERSFSTQVVKAIMDD